MSRIGLALALVAAAVAPMQAMAAPIQAGAATTGAAVGISEKVHSSASSRAAVTGAILQPSAVTFLKTLAGPGQAKLYSGGVAYDAAQNRLVVADSGLDVIDFYSLTGTRLGQFGMYGSGPGQFKTPRDTAVDAASNIYVVDTDNNRIQKFDKIGTPLWQTIGAGTCPTCLTNPIGIGWDSQNSVVLVASTGTSEIKAFDSNGNWLWTSPATIGIANPRDVARGPDGLIWVSDYNHEQIKAFNVTATGVWTTTPAIVLGDGLPSGHGVGQLNAPYNMDFSPDGKTVYVADTGNERVAQWNISNPSSPVWLNPFGSRCVNPCPNPPASIGQLEQLRRVVVVPSGNIYADDLWGNGIDYFAPNGTALGEIEGFHAPASGFAQAFGVAVAPDGTTYGVDRLNQRVERFDASGNFLNSSGVRGSSPDQESWPETVAVTPDGTVWLGDTRHDRLQHWPADLSGIPAIVGTTGTALGQFNNIEGVTSDAAGNVWVADTRNNRIQEYTPSSNTFVAFGTAGSGLGQLRTPQGLAVSSSAVYVADTNNNRIEKFDLSGNYLASYSTGLLGAQDVAIAADGTVWIADSSNNRLVHVTADLVTTLADGFGSFGTGSTQFFLPHSLAISGNTMFVADTYNNRIQEFRLSSIAPPTVTGVAPNSGPSTGGTAVTITGTGFTSGSTVNFNALLATSSFISSTQISSTSPASPAGTVDVTVTNSNGTSNKSGLDHFTFTPPIPTVTGVAPNKGPSTGGTVVTITGTGFSSVTAVNFNTMPALFNPINATQILATSPQSTAGTVDVLVTNSTGTSAKSAADHFTFTPPIPISACTTTQHTLAGSDGSTWAVMDTAAHLTVTFTPNASSFAIIGGNADLWTSSAGFNQDFGIAVTGPGFPATGQPEAWKESGGSDGTASPNAAFVQTVISVAAGQTYTATLVWKANKPDPGSIWAGAGPTSTGYSTTCINVRLVDASLATVESNSITTQGSLSVNDGTTWHDMDTTNLSLSFMAPAGGTILLSGNADLWTSSRGFNQDFGIAVAGPGIPTTTEPQAWKESGGASTFSPNAAFVQVALPVTGGGTYTAKLVWKPNRSGSSSIYSGAGPIGGQFSPTNLTLLFLPPSDAPIDAVSTAQLSLPNSDGSTWAPMAVSTIIFKPSHDCLVILGGNADVWSDTAGVNRDFGISVSGPGFPTALGQPEAWKESGGLSAFTPNAGYVQITESLSAGQTYTFQLVWKANRSAPGATIYSGAGPGPTNNFSPTRLTLQPIGC